MPILSLLCLLGGSRCSKARMYWNTMVVFMVSGLWHGANWTFIAWGGMHGLLQVLEDRVSQRKTESRLLNAVRIIITFIMCSCLWVFFRAPSFENAIYIFQHMFDEFPHLIIHNIGQSLLFLINEFFYIF